MTLPETFTVDEELYSSEQVLYSRECKEFVVDCAQNICLDPSSLMLPSWAGIQALLSQSEVPAMQVGFLPFIPNPVTEHATVYTAMLNFLKVAKQLNQEALPFFCDEGVFRIVLDIYLQREQQFKTLLPMLGSFQTAKCVQHCIGKYIQGSGIEDSLTQTKVLGVKVLKSVLDGTNYARALKVILILSNAITRLKWQAFLKTKDVVQVNEHAVLLSDLQQALSAKDPDRSKRAYRDCMTSVLMLKKDFDEFSKTGAEKSEMCRYWDGLIKLSKAYQPHCS